VRLILKQVRHKARNVLLIGLVEGNKPKLPKIPSIVELSRLMCRHLVAGQAAMSNVEVDAKVGPHLQIRFAYLQLETLVNHLLSKSQSCNFLQWDQIDTQLNHNCTQVVNYTNA
jgi:hypothetical protein